MHANAAKNGPDDTNFGLACEIACGEEAPQCCDRSRQTDNALFAQLAIAAQLEIAGLPPILSMPPI
jgi:hypothetical protein